MRVKVINALGETMLLPEELSLQGWPMEADLPGVEIEGHDGQVIDAGMIRLKPRTIRIMGTLQGLSKDDADRIREMIAGFVFRANPLRLYRHELSERYMLVYAQTIDHSYRVGRHGGRVFDLAIEFLAADPLHYSELVQVTQIISASPSHWQTIQPGTVRYQNPIVFLKAVGQLDNPTLVNDEGVAMSLDRTIPQGKALAVNSERHEAYITDGDLAHYLHKWDLSTEPGKAPASEINVVGQMSTLWIMHGWPLVTGSNALTYHDDAISTHNAEISLAWRPRHY